MLCSLARVEALPADDGKWYARSFELSFDHLVDIVQVPASTAPDDLLYYGIFSNVEYLSLLVSYLFISSCSFLISHKINFRLS